MEPSPPCLEKQTLTERLSEARELYIQANRNLGNQSGTHFENFFRDADVAKRDYENARAALDAHIKEHGC